MSYELLYTVDAEKCIDDQLRWYEDDEGRGGAELADQWLERLVDSLEQLKTSPTGEGFAPENGRWHAEVKIRQMRFRPWKSKPGWRILFTINEGKKEVVLLQIRHERRPLLG